MTSPTSETFHDLQYPLVMVPFHGNTVPVVLRELNQIQIKACGDFSLIETFDDKITMKKKPTIADMRKFAEVQARIAEAALVKPTYAEIMTIYDGENLAGVKQELDELRVKLHATPGGPVRKAIENEITLTEISSYMGLPTDFLASITCFTLGIDKSDIKKITEDILLDVALLAHSGHDNPADHVDGNFTPFMKDDINRRAWAEFHKWRETESKAMQRSKKKSLGLHR